MEIYFRELSEKEIQLIAECIYPEVKKYCIQYKSDNVSEQSTGSESKNEESEEFLK